MENTHSSISVEPVGAAVARKSFLQLISLVAPGARSKMPTVPICEYIFVHAAGGVITARTTDLHTTLVAQAQCDANLNLSFLLHVDKLEGLMQMNAEDSLFIQHRFAKNSLGEPAHEVVISNSTEVFKHASENTRDFPNLLPVGNQLEVISGRSGVDVIEAIGSLASVNSGGVGKSLGFSDLVHFCFDQAKLIIAGSDQHGVMAKYFSFELDVKTSSERQTPQFFGVTKNAAIALSKVFSECGDVTLRKSQDHLVACASTLDGIEVSCITKVYSMVSEQRRLFNWPNLGTGALALFTLKREFFNVFFASKSKSKPRVCAISLQDGLATIVEEPLNKNLVSGKLDSYSDLIERPPLSFDLDILLRLLPKAGPIRFALTDTRDTLIIKSIASNELSVLSPLSGHSK